MPEIYLENGIHAQQWYLMSLHSYNTLGRPIKFFGALTQYQACLQRGCTTTDNSPQEGWTQLHNLVNYDSRVNVGLYYSSDMKWQGEKDVILPTIGETIQQNETGAGPAAQKTQFLPVPQDAVVDTIPADFKPRIVEGSEGLVHTWEADIRNLWEGSYEGQFFQVLAGASPDDPSQGLLIVMITDPMQVDNQMKTILAPAGSGALRVTGWEAASLRLSSESGAPFTFDLATLTIKP